MASKPQQLKILIAKKEQYFARIQRLYDNSRDLTTAEKVNNFRVRYETLADTKIKFIEMLDEINKIECQINESFLPNYSALESFDELICNIEAVAKNVIVRTRTEESPQTPREVVTSKTIRKLPELPLPKFSGNLKDWPLFIECYNNIIHNNRDLNDIDRVNYLMGCLSGNALSVCSGISPTGDNYRIILQALIDKFEDKRLIANSYLEQLLNFKQAQCETFSTLNLFIETFHVAVTALLKLKIKDLADYILAYLAFSKLNPETQRLFENTRRKVDIPSYNDIVIFVKEQAKICARTPSQKANFVASSKGSPISPNKMKSPHSFVVPSTTNSKCGICKSTSHVTYNCSKLLEVDPQERYKLVKTNNLCINCLAYHKIVNCNSTHSCKICRSRHHTLLHFKTQIHNTPDVKCESQSTRNQLEHPKLEATGSTSLHHSSNDSITNCCSIASDRRLSTGILLATAKVCIPSKHSISNEVRFLIDSCSQANFLTLEACRRLKLNMSKYIGTVRGIGAVSSDILGVADVVIGSRFDVTKRYPLQVFIVNNITDPLPNVHIDIEALDHLQSLPLADDNLHIPSKVDGIIGAELFPYLLTDTRVVGPPNSPIAVGTTLGYVVMGTAPLASPSVEPYSFCTVLEPSLDRLVKRFWELEDIPSLSVPHPDELACEKIFQSTYQRDTTGRFTVALPFQCDSRNLGDSYLTARRRLFTLETKMDNNLEFRRQYSEIIRDYIKQGHMSLVSKYDASNSYFIPHHAVVKHISSSTPLRIVFDASCKTDSNYSLNDLLYTGAKLQSDILTTILNFRVNKIAFTADLKQMYRQIMIRERDRRFQRVLWRFSPNEPINVYQLNTVTFGMKASPFLALRCIRQLIEDEKESLSVSAEIVKRDMYVDDLVSSIGSVDLAIPVCHELTELFRRGGFHLTKWASNSRDLLNEIPIEDRSTQVVDFNTCSLKVLGLQWQPITDIFAFSFQAVEVKCTKRTILSVVARFYDPVGFLAPVTLFAKLIIKELWLLKLNWDDLAPPEISSRWNQFINSLPFLSNISIPRHLNTKDHDSVMLIGFSDACVTSFGAVVYIRTVDATGEVHVHLLCAKSKVSPLKFVSIPRLELCAAHLLSKLINYIVKCYQARLTITHIYALSDSTVVLSWIATHPSKLKTFVSNRVTQIQTLSKNTCWLHVNGKENISDSLSRGMTPSQFVSLTMWTTGPEWLKWDPEQWPVNSLPYVSNLPETINVSLIVATRELNPLYVLISRCSSWTRLLRITAYVLRFIRRLPGKRDLTSGDLEISETALLKTVQGIHFKQELTLLENTGSCSPSFRKYRPFLKDGLLRVGGRLQNSELDFDSQHPVLLPKRDPLVNMLIEHYHDKNFHTGPNLVLSLLRQRYWILSGRSVVRHIISKCNRCFKFRPIPEYPLMGNLPSCRVQEAKPFLKTGIDYAGPVRILLNRHRGARSQKAYICLFVCLAVKAVHIELVSDLSTPNFIQALKRFLARRGLCSVLYSDKGSNFVGAKGHLKDLANIISSHDFERDVQTELSTRGIQWNFIPPGAPHMGGLWEANVKSVKSHLFKVIGDQLLTYEEMNTLLIQIESLLNSRPLCTLSSDPSEPIALTPAHFLTLTPLDRLPAPNVSDSKINRLNRYTLIDQMVQQFWKRWHIEYLHTLQVREKWNTMSNPIKRGTIVVIQHPNLSPLRWPLGRIVDVFPGTDDIIRVVDVQTKDGIYRRPVTKLCPLPTQ